MMKGMTLHLSHRSRVDPARPGRAGRPRGYSLIEVMVVMAISTVVLMIAYSMIEETMRTSLFVESHNDLAQLTQRAVNTIQTEAMQSRTIFQNNAVGQAYRDNIVAQLPTNTVAPNSRLPSDQNVTTLVPDTSSGPTAGNFVGNSMLAARQLPPLLIPYDHDNNAGTPNVDFPADRYRFDFYYLKRETAARFKGLTYYLDINETRSVQFADYFQLAPLFASWTAAQRASIANGLAAAGITRAWNPAFGQPLNTSFYTVPAGGGSTVLAVIGSPTITVSRTRSLFPEFRGGRITGKMQYTVGFMSAPATLTPIRRYSIPISGQPDYPSGFEVKTFGGGNSRKLMARVVLLSNFSASRIDSHEAFVITAVGTSQ